VHQTSGAHAFGKDIMRKTLICVLLAASAAPAQYKVEAAGAPPSELAPAIQEALQKVGTKVVAGTGSVACEIWFRSAAPPGAPSAEENATLKTIPHGALLGAIRFPAEGQDRRGYTVKPGVYTLRYSLYPVNGDHQGVAPQRDFLILLRANDDTDINVNFDFDKLMDLARRASETPHPLSLSIWKNAGGASAPITKQGENDWVLHGTVGDVPVAVIVAGQFAG
jgi:hypothetical protein